MSTSSGWLNWLQSVVRVLDAVWAVCLRIVLIMCLLLGIMVLLRDVRTALTILVQEQGIRLGKDFNTVRPYMRNRMH